MNTMFLMGLGWVFAWAGVPLWMVLLLAAIQVIVLTILHEGDWS